MDSTVPVDKEQIAGPIEGQTEGGGEYVSGRGEWRAECTGREMNRDESAWAWF